MMKKLNKKTTRIFCRLLDKIATQTSTKISPDHCATLSIEKEDTGITMPQGAGYLLKIAEVSTIPNIGSPGINFIVIDRRDNPKDFDSIEVYPQSYFNAHDDGTVMEEESIQLKNHCFDSWKPIWYSGHLSTANKWLVDVIAHNYV